MHRQKYNFSCDLKDREPFSPQQILKRNNLAITLKTYKLMLK